jgi:hypothetical protein
MKQENISAVIVEIRGRNAAALTSDGAFLRMQNDRYEVGQQVLLAQPVEAAQPARKRMRLTAYAGMVAGFLLLILGGLKGYTTPAGVISLDVNPSIEYSINIFDRVLDISAVNADGESILARMDVNALRFHYVDEVVDATILALRESGYLADSTVNNVVIASSSYDARHTERIAERLRIRLGQQGDLVVLSVPVTRGEVESAHERGTSAGKLYIVEELEDSWTAAEDFDADDWIARPVREIIRETEWQREGRDEEDEEDDDEYRLTTSSPYKTPESQQSTNPEEYQHYQKYGSDRSEYESDDSPEHDEPERD